MRRSAIARAAGGCGRAWTGLWIAGRVSLLLAVASLRVPVGACLRPVGVDHLGPGDPPLHLATIGGPDVEAAAGDLHDAVRAVRGAAPALWLIVARAGAIMAVALAAVLAYRLTARGGDRAAVDSRRRSRPPA